MIFRLNILIVLVFINMAVQISGKDILPSDPNIKYYGRVTDNYIFDWPGVYIKTKFTGSSLSAIFSGDGQYNIFIDEVEYDKLFTSGSDKVYLLASGLNIGEHSLLISKVNETNWSNQTFGGLIIDDTADLNLPEEHLNKIEYIGDSFMVGYAAESGSNSDSHPDPTKAIADSTNTFKAFPAVSARAVGVEYMVNAFSGLGVLNDANGNVAQTLPAFYDYTLHSSKTVPWDFSKWVPDIVVIGLQINDFNGGAEQYEYEDTLNSFIEQIRSKYNNHPYFILCATSVYLHPEAVTAVSNVVDKQVAAGNKVFLFKYEYADLGFTAWNGVHWHPNVEEQAGIGAALANRINEIVNENGWPVVTAINKNDNSNSKLCSNVTIQKNGRIKIDISKKGFYNISLFSLNGKLQKKIEKQYLKTGTNYLSLKALKNGKRIVLIELEKDGERFFIKVLNR